MEEKTKVKKMDPLGGAMRVTLENGNIFAVRTKWIKEFGVVQGSEIRIVETESDIFLYFGEKILGSYEPK
jgi:hypothetical protein